jgi:hypothetical protein
MPVPGEKISLQVLHKPKCASPIDESEVNQYGDAKPISWNTTAQIDSTSTWMSKILKPSIVLKIKVKKDRKGVIELQYW